MHQVLIDTFHDIYAYSRSAARQSSDFVQDLTSLNHANILTMSFSVSHRPVKNSQQNRTNLCPADRHHHVRHPHEMQRQNPLGQTTEIRALQAEILSLKKTAAEEAKKNKDQFIALAKQLNDTIAQKAQEAVELRKINPTVASVAYRANMMIEKLRADLKAAQDSLATTSQKLLDLQKERVTTSNGQEQNTALHAKLAQLTAENRKSFTNLCLYHEKHKLQAAKIEQLSSSLKEKELAITVLEARQKQTSSELKRLEVAYNEARDLIEKSSLAKRFDILENNTENQAKLILKGVEASTSSSLTSVHAGPLHEIQKIGGRASVLPSSARNVSGSQDDARSTSNYLLKSPDKIISSHSRLSDLVLDSSESQVTSPTNKMNAKRKVSPSASSILPDSKHTKFEPFNASQADVDKGKISAGDIHDSFYLCPMKSCGLTFDLENSESARKVHMNEAHTLGGWFPWAEHILPKAMLESRSNGWELEFFCHNEGCNWHVKLPALPALRRHALSHAENLLIARDAKEHATIFERMQGRSVQNRFVLISPVAPAAQAQNLTTNALPPEPSIVDLVDSDQSSDRKAALALSGKSLADNAPPGHEVANIEDVTSISPENGQSEADLNKPHRRKTETEQKILADAWAINQNPNRLERRAIAQQMIAAQCPGLNERQIFVNQC